jgi:hypothetical protein
MISQIVSNLEARCPAAPSMLVERCVTEAAVHFSSARIRLHLPVLIERRAHQALLEAMRPSGPGL